MEVYNDDMLIKSKKVEENVRDLIEKFRILWKYGMKLNPPSHLKYRLGSSRLSHEF